MNCESQRSTCRTTGSRAHRPLISFGVSIDEPGHRYQAVSLLVLRLGGVEVGVEQAGRSSRWAQSR
jgi:hypothetical protein